MRIRVSVLGMLALASCQMGGPRAAGPPAARDEFPRCLASDGAGNPIACSAPKRVYDGESCVCADGHGHAFYGRVQEHPR